MGTDRAKLRLKRMAGPTERTLGITLLLNLSSTTKPIRRRIGSVVELRFNSTKPFGTNSVRTMHVRQNGILTMMHLCVGVDDCRCPSSSVIPVQSLPLIISPHGITISGAVTKIMDVMRRQTTLDIHALGIACNILLWNTRDGKKRPEYHLILQCSRHTPFVTQS